jgi:hypothetical protein
MKNIYKVLMVLIKLAFEGRVSRDHLFQKLCVIAQKAKNGFILVRWLLELDLEESIIHLFAMDLISFDDIRLGFTVFYNIKKINSCIKIQTMEDTTNPVIQELISDGFQAEMGETMEDIQDKVDGINSEMRHLAKKLCKKRQDAKFDYRCIIRKYFSYESPEEGLKLVYEVNNKEVKTYVEPEDVSELLKYL